MNLELALRALRAARCPEDVFGAETKSLAGARAGLLRVVHPDYNPDHKAEAEEAFRLLGQWWTQAQARVAAGTYGQRLISYFTLRTKLGAYTVTGKLADGDVAEIFEAGDHLVKLARHARDNDLLANEAAILARLWKHSDYMRYYQPELVESVLAGGRRANIFVRHPRPLTPVSAILEAFPGGIDPRDMVWMWKRCLAGLGRAHGAGIIHGAVTPDHLLLDLKDHGAKIVGWGAAVTRPAGEGLFPVKVISTKWQSLYPPEIPKKLSVDASADLYMLAKTMWILLGNRYTAPRPLYDLLKGCLHEQAKNRLDNAWWVHEQIDGMLTRLFGPRHFRTFTMPSTNKES